MWLAAWKLVFNDAKRTVAPRNAKHSTLLQGCFLCFCFFDSIHDSAIMQNRFLWGGDLLWGEGLGEDFDEAREGVAIEVGLRNPNDFGRKCGFGGGFE